MSRVGDLDEAWAAGYTELELLKRATLAGIGTCQGGACLPHVRAWIGARTGVEPEPFTARPGARQISLAEAAADASVDVFRRTALHDEHLALGATMDRFGGWWRPWHYGDVLAEYRAVREAVSVGDVSTLGKLVVSGPDVVEALERIYPCHVADIKPGRSRYALLLNERGHVMDDGMILRESETRFALTFTSGGAANAEMWLRDWIDTWGLRVHVLDRTMSLAAINVTGPLAGELLQPPRPRRTRRASSATPMSRSPASRATPCASRSPGEAAWELHHPIDRSVELWRALMDAGADLGIVPHGLQALFGLRLEKGHVIVGMDTELDTTPRRIGMDWAARMDKPWFIGRTALERTASIPDDRRWVGFSMDGPAPVEGTPIFDADGREVIGNVTGSWTSPVLGKALMLGWQRRPPHADRVTIDGREAVVTPTRSTTRRAIRARALSRSPASASWPTRRRSTRWSPRSRRSVPHLRLAPDDVLVIGTAERRRRRPGCHRRARDRVRRRRRRPRGRGPPHGVADPARTPGVRPGRDRRRAGPPLAGPRRRAGDADHRRGLRRRAGRAAGAAR